MGIRGVAMRLFRVIFREQKTRLQIDWLTHTDERIMEELADGESAKPVSIAADLDRSEEYVADRCRLLALRGLANAASDGDPQTTTYRLSDLGERYLRGEVDAEELEEQAEGPHAESV